jgi:hypothetical protein
MLKFSKKKCKEVAGDEFYKKNEDWLKECHGLTVIFRPNEEFGVCEKTYYFIHSDWCVEFGD